MSAISAMLSPSVILSEVRVNARASRRTPVQPLVTMPIQGVLPKHFLVFFHHSITRDVGDFRDALTHCHPERSARERARESKDPGAAVGDHADSGSSTETFFLLIRSPILPG